MAKSTCSAHGHNKCCDSVEPNLSRALRLVLQLMAIPGKSGQEREVVDFLKHMIRQSGVTADCLHIDDAHRRTLVPGDTGNLILRLPGTIRGPRRLFAAHMDTVPICVGCRPQRRGDALHSSVAGTGLGADDRAGCAVLLNTVLELIERRLPHPPLTFCWSVQEEIGLQGARHLNRRLLGNPRLGFNWDGGSPSKLTLGATGGYRMSIEVTGLASHAGAAPEHGISAIAIAGLAIADLQRGGWHGAIDKAGQAGTSNIGHICGGEATNIVTDRVTIRAEARSHHPRFRNQIVREIKSAFQRAAREVRNAAGACGKVRVQGRLDYESFLLRSDEPCVRIAVAAVQSVGRQAELAVSNGGLDANWFFAHGIPTVSLGCGQRHPHAVGESMDIADFQDACRIALRLATGQES